ncbi:MAG: hypothetical protein JJU12_03375 [Chlamydiales bacterium]|nr:hypothetical protein [Chlamydiales bacterium]
MMSRKKKILIIFHLIFAFSFLTWLVIKPYTMEVVSRKSQRALYEKVLQREELFQNLSIEEQEAIREGYHEVAKRPAASLFKSETPAFGLAWLFFSILICILLLFNIEGARTAVWILPLLVVGYGYFLYASPQPQRPGLFPSEQYVRETYLEGIEGNREQLLKGWHLYLVNEWAQEAPSEEPALFEQQVDKGLFAFNIARLQWIRDGKGDEVVLAGFTSPPSLFRVISYFLWNLAFAWVINRREKSLQSEPLSSPS